MNESDQYGWTPLRKAARVGATDILMLLIEAGAQVKDSPDAYWAVITAASWGTTAGKLAECE